jgi:aspartyl/glutamyl-tRNA(Asn/Gln) amidotransferase C subunit
MQLQDIQKLAQVSRIMMSDKEAEGLSKDLEATLKYIDESEKAPVPDDAMFIPEHRNVTRPDVVTTTPGQYTDILLSSAVATQDGYVKVTKIL